jgi:hypothetical protein
MQLVIKFAASELEKVGKRLGVFGRILQIQTTVRIAVDLPFRASALQFPRIPFPAGRSGTRRSAA